MPYVDQTRQRHNPLLGRERFDLGRGRWRVMGQYYSCPGSLPFLDTERIWGYRTGTTISRETSQQLSGVELNKLVRGNKAFSLDDFGGVSIEGDAASNEVLYPFDTGHNLRQLKTQMLESGVVRQTRYLPSGDSLVEYPFCLLDAGVYGPRNPYRLPDWTDTEEKTEHYQLANRKIARVSPTAPASNFVRAMGEIVKDGLPDLRMASTGVGGFVTRHREGILSRTPVKGAPDVGGEYLNYQFGIASSVSDIQGTLRSVSKAGDRARKYQSALNDYQVVHKRAIIKQVNNASHDEDLLGLLNVGIASVPGRPDLANYRSAYDSLFIENLPSSSTLFSRVKASATYTEKEVVALTCAFDIYKDDLNGILGRLIGYGNKADAIMGSKLDPDVVYQLAPWTWLMNWVSDFGGMIARADALSGNQVVLRFGYVTHVREVSTHFNAKTGWRSVNSVLEPTLTLPPVITTTRSFSRWRATPYGFGLNLVDLSPGKIAILAALGLTKGLGGAQRLREY